MNQPQDGQLSPTGRKGLRGLLQNILSSAQDVVMDEIVPIHTLKSEEEHVPVFWMETVAQGLSVLTTPAPLVCGEVLQTPHAAGHLPTQSHCKWLTSHRPHGQVGEVGRQLMQHHLMQPVDGVVVLEGASREPDHSFKWVLHEVFLGGVVDFSPSERHRVTGYVVVNHDILPAL